MVAEQAGKENPHNSRQEVGADWEDAFQAEDFLISPDSAPETLFDNQTDLPPAATAATGGGRPPASQEAIDEKKAVPVGDSGARKRGGMPPVLVTFFEAIGDHAVLAPLRRLPGGLGEIVFRVAPVWRGVVLLLAVALAVGGGAAYFLSSSGQAVSPVAEEKVLPEQEIAQEKEPAPAAPAVAEEQSPSRPSPAETAMQASAAPREQKDLVEVERHKWRFSSFMIDAGADEAGKPSYVVVDLSLVLHLEPGVDFPADKEYMVRNMIFQFFNNRPPYELRRFSLARGEMKQKLRAWFNKEWPENRIEAILFHRYQVI